jgi:hypothetical protein
VTPSREKPVWREHSCPRANPTRLAQSSQKCQPGQGRGISRSERRGRRSDFPTTS